MSPIIKILSLLSFISAGTAIYFRQIENIKYFAVFKPLTTLLIISISIIIFRKQKNSYTRLLIIALVLALIGDVFLLKEAYFLYGLVAFLLAHIVFTKSFVGIFGLSNKVLPLVILLIAGGLYYAFLFDKLAELSIPVAVYLLVILIMNWQAIGLMFKNKHLVYKALALGAILFTVSDGMIAYAKFVAPFQYAEILILSTYWIAIYSFTIAGIYIQGNKKGYGP